MARFNDLANRSRDRDELERVSCRGQWRRGDIPLQILYGVHVHCLRLLLPAWCVSITLGAIDRRY